MFKKLFLSLLGFSVFITLPSFSNCCGMSSCSGNMQIAPWGPSNYQERPIFPLRGCGPMGCQKGWRSGIIYPPPTRPYGGQVISSPPVGCSAPVTCSAPVACSAPIMPRPQPISFVPGLMPPPGCMAPAMIMPPPPPAMPQPYMPPPAFREPVRGLW